MTVTESSRLRGVKCNRPNQYFYLYWSFIILKETIRDALWFVYQHYRPFGYTGALLSAKRTAYNYENSPIFRLNFQFTRVHAFVNSCLHV